MKARLEVELPENCRTCQLEEKEGDVNKMSELERDISFLKTYVAIVQGIEILEYYDSNFLSGNNESRCKEKIEHLNLALKKIDEISKKLNLI